AREAGDRAVEVAERLTDPELISLARTSRALAYLLTGEWDRAEADVDTARSLAQERSARNAAAFALIQRGRLDLYRGDWDEALQALEESAALAREGRNLFHLRWAQAAIAERDLLIGRPEDARKRLESMDTGSMAWDDLTTEDIRATRIWAYLELGQLERATVMLNGRLAGLERAGHLPAAARELWLHAMLAARCARWDEAESALERGLALARSLPYPFIEGRLLTLYGQMEVTRGKRASAREPLESALSIFRRLGACADVERVERTLKAFPA
ncbi:MAG: hypothetical protein JOZ41_21650, partial [Chloroflexi bacterium]|nr:hypothetical protein [Chloroflexota bacterium]